MIDGAFLAPTWHPSIVRLSADVTAACRRMRRKRRMPTAAKGLG